MPLLNDRVLMARCKARVGNGCRYPGDHVDWPERRRVDESLDGQPVLQRWSAADYLSASVTYLPDSL